MLYSLKNFAITFVIAAVLFGVVAYYISGFVMKTVADPLGVDKEVLENILNRTGSDDTADIADTSGTSADPSLPVSDTPFDSVPAETDENGEIITTAPETTELSDAVKEAAKLKGESFTALLIGTDYRPEDFDDYVESYKDGSHAEFGVLSKKYRTVCADTIILVRVDKERGEFLFSNIPSETQVLIGTQYLTLAQLYSYYGRDYIVKKVEALTGLAVDYYGVLNITALPDVMDELDGITFTVPYDIYLSEGTYYRYVPEGKEGTLVLPAGRQKIESKAIIPLVSFWQYPRGVFDRVNVCIQLAETMLTKLAAPENLLNLPAIFDSLRGVLDTNVTLSDITENSELIFAYNKLTSVVLTYPGEFTDTGDGVVFTPDTIKAVERYSEYR